MSVLVSFLLLKKLSLWLWGWFSHSLSPSQQRGIILWAGCYRKQCTHTHIARVLYSAVMFSKWFPSRYHFSSWLNRGGAGRGRVLRCRRCLRCTTGNEKWKEKKWKECLSGGAVWQASWKINNVFLQICNVILPDQGSRAGNQCVEEDRALERMLIKPQQNEANWDQCWTVCDMS